MYVHGERQSYRYICTRIGCNRGNECYWCATRYNVDPVDGTPLLSFYTIPASISGHKYSITARQRRLRGRSFFGTERRNTDDDGYWLWALTYARRQIGRRSVLASALASASRRHRRPTDAARRAAPWVWAGKFIHRWKESDSAMKKLLTYKAIDISAAKTNCNKWWNNHKGDCFVFVISKRFIKI